MAAVGALNGAWFAIYALLYSGIAGGIIAVIILTFKGQLIPVLENLVISLTNFASLFFKKGYKKTLVPIHSGIRFPYGIAILVGTCVAYYVR